MPHIYLAPYVGAGLDEDAFRPRGNEQPGWKAIDLRPDSRVLAGRGVMSVPVRDDTIGTYLGDAPDEVSAAVKSAVESRLGITLEATRLRQILPELLIAHAREDGTRWRPLRASLDGLFRIYLGGLWWEARSLSGGTTITESFNTGDSDTLGPDLPWTEFNGDFDVVSNQVRVGTLGTTAEARANSDLATDDHYAQLVLPTMTLGTASSILLGPFCRKDSTATRTYYRFTSTITTTDNFHELAKVVGGSKTTLGSTDPTDFSAGEVVLVQANGSAITGKINGTTSVGPITDTAISGNLRCGIVGFVTVASTGVVAGDSFEAGDLAVTAGGAHGAMYPRMQRHIHQSWTVPRIG